MTKGVDHQGADLSHIPRVSIITRTINGREVFLERAIDSVLSQTFSDYIHVIVVDDVDVKPANKLVKKRLQAYRGRVKIVQTSQERGRMEAATNLGLSKTKSKYVVIHDDDDSWEPLFLEETVRFMETKKDRRMKGVVTRSVKIVESLAKKKIVEYHREVFNPFVDGITLYRMLGENYYPPISFLYERAVFSKIGEYSEELPVLGDWDFNIRFLRQFDIGFIPKPLAHYHFRYTDDQIIGNTLTTGISMHHQYAATIRNRALRSDLERDHLGEGYIMGESYSGATITRRLNEILKKLDVVEEEIRSVHYLVLAFRHSILYRILKKVKEVIRQIH